MFRYFIITLVVVVVGFAGVIIISCLSNMPSTLAKATAIGWKRKGFKFHASLRQAFLRRQKLMQYEYSCTNVHNKVNIVGLQYAYYFLFE